MVTSESNRVQSPTTAAYERQTQMAQPSLDVAAKPRPAGLREPFYVRDPVWFISLVTAGATIGSILGLSALVLAILGLTGVAAIYMLPVAGIVLGLAFLMLGAIGVAWAREFHFSEHATARDRTIFFTGVAAVWIAGLAAIVLGILNFAVLGDVRFEAIAVILLGLGLLWHGGITRRVSRFAHEAAYLGVEGREPSGPLALNALTLAPLRDFLIGLGGVILGILAMMHIVPLTLVFIALLALGVGLAFTVSTICGAAVAMLPSACSKG